MIPSSKHDPQIAVLLPFAERFDASKAGAIALCVREAAQHSRYRHSTRIYGVPVERPLLPPNYHGIEPIGRWFRGRNKGLAEGFWRAVRHAPPALVEIHNRPQVFFHLARRSPTLPLALYLHNDPQTMAALRSPAARQAVLDRAAVVYCVSDYIRRRMVDGLSGNHPNARTVINGAVRLWETPPEKENLILFVGRLIETKGALEFVEGVARVLERHPDWRAAIVGAPRPGSQGLTDDYQKQVYERFARIGPQAEFLEFRPHHEVMDLFSRAAIAVVPSKWQEPCARVLLEALAAGCALVSSDRGGSPEIVTGRGMLLPDVTGSAIEAVLERVVADADLRRTLQDRAWNDFPFTAERVSTRLDDLRDQALSGQPFELQPFEPPHFTPAFPVSNGAGETAGKEAGSKRPMPHAVPQDTETA